MGEPLKVADWLIKEWEETYHPLNVINEIEKMKLWLAANPKRAKKKNWSRFVINWLNRAHAQVVVAQVQARLGSRVGAYKDVRESQMVYSASDRAFYEQWYKEHPELKPSWWEDSDGRSEPSNSSAAHSSDSHGRRVAQRSGTGNLWRQGDSESHT